MTKLDDLGHAQYIFGVLLMMTNRIETLMERELKPFDLTAKQWFLSALLETLYDGPPTLKEAAREMGSSYQNVKQVALKLESKGLLEFLPDKKDRRVTRLRLAPGKDDFWASTQPTGQAFSASLFAGIPEEDLAATRRALKTLWRNLERMEEPLAEGED